MSRTAKAIGGLLLIGIAVGIATGWIWSSTATATEAVGQRIDKVAIDNDSGNVTVRAGDVTSTQVKQTFSYRFDRPDDTAFDVEGSTLQLNGCGWWCTVDYEVTVPEGTTVTGKVDSGNVALTGVASATVEADSGNITLRDIAGQVTVNVDSGNVALHDIGGEITLDADSGNVDGTGLGGAVVANVDSGDVNLTFAEAADVTADIDSGNIDLAMPEGPYEVVGESDSGERNVQVATDPDAEHILRIEVDSGDLSIVPAGG